MNIFTKSNILLFITLIVAVAFILLLSQYLITAQELKITQATLKTYQYNAKILAFTKLFVAQVLKSDGAVPLDQVLKLENAARDINNKPIYDGWQAFLGAKTQLEAQIDAKNLLELLVDRVVY